MKHKHRWQCVDCGAVKCAAVKGRKRDEFAEQHSSRYCYCLDCLPIRRQEALDETQAMIASGKLSPTWQTDKRITDNAADVKLESIGDIEARLSVCACGHVAATHDQDALGNLLSCTVKNCRCDHFHYDADKVAA